MFSCGNKIDRGFETINENLHEILSIYPKAINGDEEAKEKLDELIKEIDETAKEIKGIAKKDKQPTKEQKKQRKTVFKKIRLIKNRLKLEKDFKRAMSYDNLHNKITVLKKCVDFNKNLMNTNLLEDEDKAIELERISQNISTIKASILTKASQLNDDEELKKQYEFIINSLSQQKRID